MKKMTTANKLTLTGLIMIVGSLIFLATSQIPQKALTQGSTKLFWLGAAFGFVGSGVDIYQRRRNQKQC